MSGRPGKGGEDDAGSFRKKHLRGRSASAIERAPLAELNQNQNTTMSEEATPQQSAQGQVQLDTAGLTTGYVNVVGLAANINEVYLTVGVNSGPYNPSPTEPVKLSSRVIMTPDAAKRLCLNLNATLAA